MTHYHDDLFNTTIIAIRSNLEPNTHNVWSCLLPLKGHKNATLQFDLQVLKQSIWKERSCMEQTTKYSFIIIILAVLTPINTSGMLRNHSFMLLYSWIRKSLFIVTIKIHNKTVSALITGRSEHDVQITGTKSHETTFNHAFDIYPTSHQIQYDLIYMWPIINSYNNQIIYQYHLNDWSFTL